MSEMSDARHWNRVYSTKSTNRVGWFTPHLKTSVEWIEALELKPAAAIIDVGGGASTLVDDLLEKGHSDITVLDLSHRALSLTQARLGSRCARVTWIEGDITKTELPRQRYSVWHDRAVFHFLTQPEEKNRYRAALLKSLQPNGFLIIGAFSHEAPPKCSGLPVQRYSAYSLAAFFCPELELTRHHHETHITPSGVEQPYVYCLFQRSGPNDGSGRR